METLAGLVPYEPWMYSACVDVDVGIDCNDNPTKKFTRSCEDRDKILGGFGPMIT